LIPKLACAYSLGEMVERASLKGKKIYFHRHSTRVVDFMKILMMVYLRYVDWISDIVEIYFSWTRFNL
jgi:hypothetical protein